MATNKIDYDTLEQVATTYGKEAEAISSVLTKLNSTNQVLAEGWQNKTSEAFLARYEREHKKALEAARNAIAEISSYIKEYRAKEIERDASGASSISR